MSLLLHLSIAGRRWRHRIIRRVLAHRVQHRNPTLVSHDTAIWDYGYNDLDAIQIGQHVSVGAYTEILVHKRSVRSKVEGRLVLGDRAIITAGVNLRAAGGAIRIGRGSGIGQNSVLVACNHQVRRGQDYLSTSWDESKTGIDIGANVWIGAGCVILPGVSIGDNAVIGAGSVVTGEIPLNEIWAGVPARKIRDVPGDEAAEIRTRYE